MAWIESNQEVGRHPKTKKLARLLDISAVAAVGHLHFLWWWALDFAQDGVLNKYDEFDISEACMWEGDEKLFVDALIQAGFIDKNESILSIHDWYEYAGRLIERRQSDAERKREERNKKKISKKSTSGGHPADIHNKSTEVLRNSTVPNSTEPNNNNNNTREEIEESVNDFEKTVSETTQNVNELSEIVSETEDDRTMAIGTRAVNWAEKNWGRMISPGEAEDIIAWCDEFFSRGSPDPDAVLIEALNECDAAGPEKRNRKYLGAILGNWQAAGVLTVEHAKTRNAEHKSKYQKENKRGNKDPVNKSSSSKYENFYL